MKTIVDYQVIVHGVEWPDYFQGCGVCCTEYTDVATGIGDSVREALEDALDSLAQADWDTSALDAEVEAADDTDLVSQDFHENGGQEEDYEDAEHPNVYVSVRVK